MKYRRRTPEESALKRADEIWSILYRLNSTHPGLGAVEELISILATKTEKLTEPITGSV